MRCLSGGARAASWSAAIAKTISRSAGRFERAEDEASDRLQRRPRANAACSKSDGHRPSGLPISQHFPFIGISGAWGAVTGIVPGGHFLGPQAVRIQDRVKKTRGRNLFKQMNVRNYAMSANKAGKITSFRQKIDFVEKVERLFIVRASPLRVTVQFLGEGNQHAEICGLGKLRQLQCLYLADTPASHPCGAKMPPCAIGIFRHGRSDKLHVTNQVVSHHLVRSTHDSAIDDGKAWLETRNIRKSGAFELCLRLIRDA